MMFRFPDGSTKVIEYGHKIVGLQSNGMRPFSVLFTLEEVQMVNEQDVGYAARYLRYVRAALNGQVSA